MIKKINIKTVLIIALVLLIAIFGGNYYKKTRNVRFNFAGINIGQVQKIQVKLPTSNETITVIKKDRIWHVSNGNEEYKADIRIVANYLNKLTEIKPQKIITRKRRKWKKYQVTETNGIHIKLFYSNEKPILDFIVGKSNYEKPADPFGGDAITDTYYRFTNNNVVYQTAGLMQKHLDRNFNDWRNKLLTNFKSNKIEKISFSYPDSSYTLELKKDQWICNKYDINNNRVLKYISNVQYEDAYQFENNFTPESDPIYTLTFFGKDKTELAKLDCYKINNDDYIIHSSQNKNSYFRVRQNDIVNQFFKSLDYFKKR